MNAFRLRSSMMAGILLAVALCPTADSFAATGLDNWDKNQDGAYDALDASFLLDEIASGTAKADMDCTCDGAVTAADTARFLRFALGETAALIANTFASDSELLSAAQRAAHCTFSNVDLSEYSDRMAGQDLALYDTLAKNRVLFSQLADALNGAADAAAETAAAMLFRETGENARPEIPKRRLLWKQAAALYRALGDSLPGVLADTLVIHLNHTNQVTYVSLEFPLHDEILYAGTREQFLTGKFTYAYLNTVYDDVGNVQTYIPYPLSEGYLATLAHPLNDGKKTYLIKDGWYDPRSRNTRMHTGTDILAPARTPIRSVTEGVVQWIGYMPIPGNYVVVLDPYGFEYHYYHMVEQSKAVSEGDIVHQGDVIGLVGNTGNSAANHLHLTILSPDYTYINPYDVFRDAGVGPIRENIGG